MAPDRVNTKVSSVIAGRNSSGWPNVNCTVSEETLKAAMVESRFWMRPVRRLSKSTKPPAITPSTNGIHISGFCQYQTASTAMHTLTSIGSAASTRAESHLSRDGIRGMVG